MPLYADCYRCPANDVLPMFRHRTATFSRTREKAMWLAQRSPVYAPLPLAGEGGRRPGEGGSVFDPFSALSTQHSAPSTQHSALSTFPQGGALPARDCYDSARLMRDILGIGLSGKTLTDLERRFISDSSPYAVVLFGRNVGTAEELRDLVHEVKSIAKRPPVIMIDQEGGRVDRLRNLIPGLPSAEAFGEGEKPPEMAAWAGQIIGGALRFFDIEIDLAPVVDVRSEPAPKGLERRTFGADPDTVTDLAGAFMRGLHSQGVASCLKHWPGIGLGSADPHYGATVIDISMEDLMRRDVIPFARLGKEAQSIMIGHGTYPQIDEPDLPATLSWKMTTDLLRNAAGFEGLAVSDDMEMHAVSDLGSYEAIAERALMAGNDVILFCSHIERMPDVQDYLRSRAAEDVEVGRRFDEASARAEAFRAHCEKLRTDAGSPVSTFDKLIEETARFCDEFERTRPRREPVAIDSDRRKGPRHPGKGHTGREEWT
jgi:beta-N-acetylhexosaminidase